MARIALTLAALASFGTDRALSQAPTPALSILGYTNGQARLQSTATSASEMRFEGSFDLANWFFIRPLPATSEKVEIVYSNTPPASAMFFRTRPGSSPEPIRIVPQLDPKLTAVALLTPEDGGQMTVTSREGVRFDFVADTNTVTEAVAIRMTVITNFSSFPAHDGFRAAVAFEPDGLEFRRSAKLRITFPATIPVPDMLGYSFDGDGSGFHLTPSRPSSNAVELAVIHFSGAGVAKFSSSTPPTFDKAWTTQRDARYAANDRAARRDSQVTKDLYSGRITEQKANFELDHNEATRMTEIYKTGVQPFLEAATKDCAIGRAVVAAELERLSSEEMRFTGAGLDKSFYHAELAKIMPAVRCNCAHELIRRCETDPKASGSALLHALNDLLLDARLATGRTDAQGCDLGSDEAIRDRLESSRCFQVWAGTITLSIIQTKKGDNFDSTGDRGPKSTWDNKVAWFYSGQVTDAGDPLVIGRDEVWSMKTAGSYVVTTRRKEVTTRKIGDDVTETRTTSHDEGTQFLGSGLLNLFLSDGTFHSVSGAAEVADELVFTFTEVSEAVYQCEDSYFASNPNRGCPTSPILEYHGTLPLIRTFEINQGSSPPPTVILNEKSFSLNWEKKTMDAANPPLVTVERVEINLVKKKR